MVSHKVHIDAYNVIGSLNFRFHSILKSLEGQIQDRILSNSQSPPRERHIKVFPAPKARNSFYGSWYTRIVSISDNQCSLIMPGTQPFGGSDVSFGYDPKTKMCPLVLAARECSLHQ